MKRDFDPGYVRAPYRRLVADFPDESAYPTKHFRVEWGPIFHRGRLDGTARVLVIGQDPAAHESIARRILVGEAGQRAQGLLARLGIDRSYVFVNTFLYSVFGGAGSKYVDDVGVVAYKVKEHLTVDGQPLTLEAADSSTWVRRDGEWVCALHTEAIAGDPFGRDKQAS